MGFSIRTGSMFSITSYAEAVKHFAREPESRSRSRGRLLFNPNERPLRDNRSPHLRLVAGPDMAYFDCVLYQTPMVRYYKPEDGVSRVLLHCHNSTSSSTFMHRHWFSNTGQFPTTDDRMVYVPLVGNDRIPGVNETWAADLRFVASAATGNSRVLDTTKSWHHPVKVPRTSKERIAERKAKVKPFEPYIDMFLRGLGTHEWVHGGNVYPETLDDAAAGDADALATVLRVFQWACHGHDDPKAARAAMRNAIVQGYRMQGTDTYDAMPMFATELPAYNKLRSA